MDWFTPQKHISIDKITIILQHLINSHLNDGITDSNFSNIIPLVVWLMHRPCDALSLMDWLMHTSITYLH